MRIRTEVLGALSFGTTHHYGTRPLLIDCHSKKGIALVVPKANIEAWPMLFDEVVLQHQCFNFVPHLDPLDRLSRCDHRSSPWVQMSSILKILGHSRTQVACLAYVDNTTVCVFELI
jgi:hypothetical protein